jgi:hypothetical protein
MKHVLSALGLAGLLLAGCQTETVKVADAPIDQQMHLQAKEALQSLGQNLATKYNLQLIGVECENPQCTSILFLRLNSSASLTLGEGRALIVPFMQEFLQNAQKDPVLVAYVKQTALAEQMPDTSVNMDVMGADIEFWQENMSHPLAPYLAKIIVAEGKIGYSYAHPHTEAVEPPFEETFSDAVNRIGQ